MLSGSLPRLLAGLVLVIYVKNEFKIMLDKMGRHIFFFKIGTFLGARGHQKCVVSLSFKVTLRFPQGLKEP